MKILFVVPYVPSQIRVRPYNLIRSLAARGHQVTVATVWTDERERRELDELKGHGVDACAVQLSTTQSVVNCLRALPGKDPLQAWYSWSPALVSQVRRLAPLVDVVHVEHLRGAHYGLAAVTPKATSGTPVIWDSVDCISHLFEQAAGARGDVVGRLIRRLELPRTRRFEGSRAGEFDRVLVSSGVDQASMHDLATAMRGEQDPLSIAVLTNGVDLQYFTPTGEPREPDALVFSGKMSYHANEAAVIQLIAEIMPAIWPTRPATRLIVVGKDPSKKLRRLLETDPARVTVTGTVADIRPHLRGASVAVVPLVYGAGCQNKVLEAMACATPVVATSRAVSALKAERNRDVVVADGSESFARAVLDLLADQNKQREIGLAGRRYVETHHRWEHVADRLENIYREAMAERHFTPLPQSSLRTA